MEANKGICSQDFKEMEHCSVRQYFPTTVPSYKCALGNYQVCPGGLSVLPDVFSNRAACSEGQNRLIYSHKDISFVFN